MTTNAKRPDFRGPGSAWRRACWEVLRVDLSGLHPDAKYAISRVFIRLDELARDEEARFRVVDGGVQP
jgi:hypothetical protein